MKLSVWAKQQGLSYRTALRLFHSGKLPLAANQLQTGTILVSEPPTDKYRTEKTVIYARVSSQDQKSQLNDQVARLCIFATSKKLSISEVVTEIASGMNGRRKKLNRLLNDKSVKNIIVEHRDRLARLGFESIEAALRASGRTIWVAEEKEVKEDKDDLVRDMVEVLTSFCARLYGRRSAENRAKRAVKYLEAEDADHDMCQD